MATNKKSGGFITKLMMGKEKSEGYAKASLPSNRWELFFDIIKGNFWKIVLTNILILLFFIPMFALFFIRYSAILNYGVLCPYSQSFGVGYQSVVSLVGFHETILVSIDTIIYLFFPIVTFIAMIGVAGGAHVMRNMVWTEGIFVSNDFWKGIKQNFKQLFFVALIYSIFFYTAMASLSVLDQMLAIGTTIGWLLQVLRVIVLIVLVFMSIATLHMITMSVTYELKFRQLFKNSFLMTIGLLPQNLFFGVIALFPFALLFSSGILFGIGLILILLIAFSYSLLVWTDYCQWSYDKFLNDRVPGAKKNRGIYEKTKGDDKKALQSYKEQLEFASLSTLSSRPIKPITDEELTVAELPTSFNRNDIVRLNESKQAIYDDHERYVAEHKNDPEYNFSEQIEKLDKESAERQKRIEKAKRALQKRKK